jgi:hypothetical protein
MFLNKMRMSYTGSIKNRAIRLTEPAGIVLAIILAWTGCRGDEEQVTIPFIQSFAFTQPHISMKVGERQAVKVEMMPAAARNYYPVTYTPSDEGYVAISETSNDGCVLTAEKGGTVVVVATAGGYTAYLEVSVDSREILQVPYIMVPTQVIEVNEGSRKSVQVSLFNGNALDNQQFKWAVEPGKDNISINPTGNTVVVQGEKRGSQKIIVSHDKSEYIAEILVFVLGVDETVKYITTKDNVITMTTGGVNVLFSAILMNGREADITGFTFRVMEEDPCISILSSNNSCNIMAHRRGTAIIRIEHPLAEYALDVRVIVLGGEESYIELDKTFVMLDIGQGTFINASMGGSYRENWNGDFFYKTRGDTDCVDINQTNFSFYVTAIKSGKCVIEIANKNINYSREALIVVRDAAMVPADEYYITTSQNVMQLEIGQSLAAELNIQLINGNEGDKAGFEWTVEDGRIIEVEALDLPLGKNVTYLARSVQNRSMAEIKSVANTLALVTPKKTGMTKIIISHPKSASAATVICKVYPRGTFANVPFVLDNPQGGLIRVDTTLPDTKVQLKMVSGDAGAVGNLTWTIANTDLATVHDTKRLDNEIHGIKENAPGVTRLVVDNMNLQNPYEAAVMVGTTEQLKMMSVLYVDQVYQTVAVGQSVSVVILNSNMESNVNGILQPNALTNSDKYTLEPYDKTKLAATMIKNRLLLQGLAETTTGPIEIIVGNSSGIITPTVIKVKVVPSDTTISQPYTLVGPNFIGMNYGQEKMVQVGLTDAGAVERGRIAWKSDNAQVVQVTENGDEAKFTAGYSTSQTNITVSHSKSVNEKIIVAYVVPPGVDPEKVVVLGIERDHWLLRPGDEMMMQLITNADESADKNIRDITWSGYDESILEVDYNGSRALVKAKRTGSAVITVAHPKKLIDLKIYISVSDMTFDKSITLPSIVEMIIGENKVITAVTQGLSVREIDNITWTIDDSSAAGISGEKADLKGGRLFIQGKERGQAWLTARQDDLGYMKKILVVCARTYEELMNTFVLASEENYYRLKVGESRDIRLVSGSAGFPESERPFITWTDEGNKVVKIYADGNHAKIEAVALGITTVTVNHSLILKPVTITFETYNETTRMFVFNSNTLMMGLVIRKENEAENDDNTKNLTVGINPAGPSYALLAAADEAPQKHIFDCTPVSNQFRITGRTKGQSYLRISHPQVAEDLRVLVYTADTKADLDAMFPAALSKTNYLLKIGEKQHITITTPPDVGIAQQATSTNPEGYSVEYVNKLKKISWVVTGDTAVISRTYDIYNRDVEIEGRNAGNCALEIRYDGALVEKAYVSVKSQAAMDMSKRIVTESIIGLSPGTTNRKTSIGSNLTPDEINELEWRVINPGVVSIAPVIGDKSSQYLTAVAPGETEVVVNFGQIERYIKVYVNAAPDAYKTLNLDNRYYQLRRNDEITLTAFHAALNAAANDNWVFYPKDNSFDNKVAELSPTGKDSVKIKGVNEGIAAIVLYNTECQTDVVFYVEVNNTAPLVEAATDDWYLTAVKTVYALDPAGVMDVTRITVNGIRFPAEELAKIEWRVVSEEIDGVKKEIKEGENGVLLDLYNKKGATVNIAPRNKIGTAVVRAHHPRSVNYLDIMVICNAAMVQANPVPHITVDKEIVKLQLNESADITAAIEDIAGGYDIAQFTAESDNAQRVQVTRTGNRITVKGVQFGQALVTINHPKAEVQKKIVVMVMAGNNMLVYLTTRQNFVVLEKNNYQMVEVELAGFTDVNNRNYIWSTDDSDIININDSGKSAVITAKNVTKTAKITVQHIACMEYPLFIYVRVTEKTSGPPVYITTNNNIVSVKEGNSLQIKANLVNAGAYENANLEWKTVDVGLIELNYSGDTALVKGLKAGTGAVHISHRQGLSLNTVTVLVVVELVAPNNGIYITTDTLLIEMGTTESQRKITARLVGGNAEDIYGFQWSITNYVSIVKQGSSGVSYQVIDINANADTCYVSPKRNTALGYIEGEALITISHPKTDYKLDIKVVVSDQTDIEFGQNYVTMDQYSQVVIPVKAPSNGLLQYACTNSSIVQVSGTNSVCVMDALAEGTVIVTAYNMSGTKSSEMVVRVNKVDLNNYFWLKTSSSIVTMTTNQNAVIVNVEVIDSKTNIKNNELTNKLRWKIKESDRANDIVRLNGSTNAAVVVQNKEVLLQPHNSGTAEVIVGFFDNFDDSIFNAYPALKGLTKTIYVKVAVADYLFVLSDMVVRMNEAATKDGIWARVDGVGDINYRWDTDITWKSDDPNIVEVVQVPGYEMIENDFGVKLTQSNVRFQARAPGSAIVKVWYKGNYQVISVVVEANSNIEARPTSVPVMPDTDGYFTVTGIPTDEPISLTIDSSGYCEIWCRKKIFDSDYEDDKNNTNPWVSISGLPNFTAGSFGYRFKVRGTQTEGATLITLEMKDKGRKTQVKVTNLKNYYIKPAKLQMRFAPNGRKTDNTPNLPVNPKDNILRNYYTISPDDDELVWDDSDLQGSFVIKSITENGEKYLQFSLPTGKPYYEAGYYPVHLRSKKGIGDEIILQVYIYYDKVKVGWKQDTINGSSGYTDFDTVNYAVTVADKESIDIKMVLDDINEPNSGVEIINGKVKFAASPDPVNFQASNRDKYTVWVLNNNNPVSTTIVNTLLNVDYVGLLQVHYQYYNGKADTNLSTNKAVFIRNILVYKAHWSIGNN